jgi:hypothetical protein
MESRFCPNGCRMASFVLAQPYPVSKSKIDSFMGCDMHSHSEISPSWCRKKGKLVDDVSYLDIAIVHVRLIGTQTLGGHWDDQLWGRLRCWHHPREAGRHGLEVFICYTSKSFYGVRSATVLTLAPAIINCSNHGHHEEFRC